MSSEVQEVTAEPIEQDIEPMSGLDLLVADITEQAQRLAAEYMPREIANEDEYKQSKRERAGARKDIAALRQRYTDSMRAIKDAVSAADAKTKAALAPLDAVDAGYKREVDAYEERWKMERRSLLAQEYADFAPDLLDLVPFDRLLARHGQEKGKQWDARSLSDPQAIAAMQEAVGRIAADERTIDDGPWSDEDKAYLKADYFQTLDLSGALRRTQEAKDQRERVARLEEERRQREAETQAEMERLRAEREEAERKRQAEPLIDTHTTMTPEEYAQACADLGTPLSAPKRINARQELQRTYVDAQTYLIALPAVSRKQVERLAATLKGQGIHGAVKPAGVLLSDEQCSDLLTYAKTRAQTYDAPKAR